LVTVVAVLGLCLFRREKYDLVLTRVMAVCARPLGAGGARPVPCQKSTRALTRDYADRISQWD
jgi:hypothetical protein